MRIVPDDPRWQTAQDPPVSQVGRVHSVESCGTVDGPGIRFIVFTSGCMLRCQYCHNPDTWNVCDGKPRCVNSLLDEVGTYADFLKRARGGITVSGGEPLIQPDFVRELLQGAKERYGMHTCLDTSGHGSLEAAAPILDHTDLVLLDIKSFDPKVYKEVTGQPIDRCLEFAKLLQDRKQPTWIRYVLVPGLSDGEENLKGLAGFLKDMSCVERIEILPFHKLGEFKWEELHLENRLVDTEPPTQTQIDRAVEILATSGHKIVV